MLVAVGAFLVFGSSRVLSLRNPIGATVRIVRRVGLWSVNHHFMDQRVESMRTALNSRDRRAGLGTVETVIRPPETFSCRGIDYFIILHDFGFSRSPTLGNKGRQSASRSTP